MTKNDALTLEALKYAASKGYGRIVREMKIAPFTIKEALAQPAQEPVEEWQGQSKIESPHNACQHRGYCKQLKAQPAQELQVRTGDCLLVGVCASEGHKIQAQRPWVGLTDEERNQLVTLHHGWNEYAQAIEAALKEKNFD